MHADDDVRMRHGNNSRARRRGIVPVTTSIESSIAGAEECAFERGVVGEGTMRVVARVVPCEMQRSGVAGRRVVSLVRCSVEFLEVLLEEPRFGSENSTLLPES